MKKVRIALGAIGIAPAVGALALAPAAQATTAHAPAKAAGTAKSVRLLHHDRAVSPAITCGSSYGFSHRSGGGLRINTVGAGSCIHFVAGEITHGQTHLSMRTRIYEFAGGPRVYSHYNGGTIGHFNSYTNFTVNPNVHGSAVCIALVETSHHSKVKYGPVCSSGF